VSPPNNVYEHAPFQILIVKNPMTGHTCDRCCTRRLNIRQTRSSRRQAGCVHCRIKHIVGADGREFTKEDCQLLLALTLWIKHYTGEPLKDCEIGRIIPWSKAMQDEFNVDGMADELIASIDPTVTAWCKEVSEDKARWTEVARRATEDAMRYSKTINATPDSDQEATHGRRSHGGAPVANMLEKPEREKERGIALSTNTSKNWYYGLGEFPQVAFLLF